jgi:drug/metabolite transporter (DMT)-like permease
MLVLGVVLAACGGATLALAMVMQRYALDVNVNSGKPSVPIFGVHVPRNIAWFLGLVLYGGANGFYAVALMHGPLSLLAGIFTTLLIFNLFFARCLLGEVLTPPKICGAIVILVGVVLCILATPQEESAETAFTPSDVQALLMRPVGVLYVLALLGSIVVSICAIVWFERKYPLSAVESAGGENASSNAASGGANNGNSTGADLPSKKEEQREEQREEPPVRLDRIMGLVYPASLGGSSVSSKLRWV